MNYYFDESKSAIEFALNSNLSKVYSEYQKEHQKHCDILLEINTYYDIDGDLYRLIALGNEAVFFNVNLFDEYIFKSYVFGILTIDKLFTTVYDRKLSDYIFDKHKKQIIKYNNLPMGKLCIHPHTGDLVVDNGLIDISDGNLRYVHDYITVEYEYEVFLRNLNFIDKL